MYPGAAYFVTLFCLMPDYFTGQERGFLDLNELTGIKGKSHIYCMAYKFRMDRNKNKYFL